MNIRSSILHRLRRTGVAAFLPFLFCSVLSAQQGRVVFSAGTVSVAKVMEEVERQANIVFAFDSRTFDASRRVRTEPRDYGLKEVMDLIVAGTDYSYLIRDDYVVINSKPKPQPRQAERTPPPAPPRRTDTAWSPARRPDAEAVAEPVYTAPPAAAEPALPARQYPAAHSAYTDPDLYSRMQYKLPHLAVKTNLLYGAALLTPNLAGELGVGPQYTVEVSGSWNRFDRFGTPESNKKLNHWILRPEFRWWFCERFDGHFLGVHAFYSEYNVSGRQIPLLFDREYRYEGNAFGAGITYGYHLPLAKRWGVEFHVGVGFAQLKYKRFDCMLCGDYLDRPTKTYFGPTRAGISLVFLIR